MFRPNPLQEADERVGLRTVVQVCEGRPTQVTDTLAIERALQIFAAERGSVEPRRLVASTMRTPGRDLELALGFFYAEGIVQTRADVTHWVLSGDQVCLMLESPALARIGEATRLTLGTSACGVCGREDPNTLAVPRISDRASLFRVAAETLERLPSVLKTQQAAFHATGGMHAAGLFSATGELLSLAEDVGRHNAVDKLIGERLLADCDPTPVAALVVSGRASYELVQKAAKADIPILIAVGAPSSLAVETAERAGMTLVGFAKVGGFNIYANVQRVGLRRVEP